MRTGEAAFLGFSPSDISVDCTRVSALPICPISQRTLVWLNFLALKIFLQVFNDFFKTFLIIYFSMSFSEAMHAVTGSCL